MRRDNRRIHWIPRPAAFGGGTRDEGSGKLPEGSIKYRQAKQRVMNFINRDKELESLNQKWREAEPQLLIIYGKRRVGKTELIKQFIRGKPSVYFLADKRTTKEQLRELSRLLGENFRDSLLLQRGFDEWPQVFAYLKEKTRERFALVIDEYPYLVETDKAISSIFQKGWDEYLKDSGIFLILSGSSVSMMESEALIYKSPLYGRRTGQILLKPLSFSDAWKFSPEKDFEEFLKIFTVTGGMPAYLLQFKTELTLEENIKNRIFAKTEYLHSEVEFILKEELREPKNYLSILKAISLGKPKFGEISNETGLEKNVLHKYFSTLEQLQLIEKETPVTEKNPSKSRKGLYKITDNFFKFWFQFVFPYKSELEIDRFDEVLRKLKEDFGRLESAAYEKVCGEIIWQLQDRTFPFERAGRWWEKNNEIDIVALNAETKNILFGECKWSNKPVGTNIYNDLKEKTLAVDWKRGDRKEFYALFSKSGFTPDMEVLAKKEQVILVEKGMPK